LAIIAAAKNSSAVINSGSSDVAHSRMVTPTIRRKEQRVRKPERHTCLLSFFSARIRRRGR
jgi:hypothetical protein